MFLSGAWFLRAGLQQWWEERLGKPSQAQRDFRSVGGEAGRATSQAQKESLGWEGREAGWGEPSEAQKTARARLRADEASGCF